MNDVVGIISAFIGTLGFALFFNIKKERLLYASVGGLITWCVYLGAYHAKPDILIANMIAAIFTTFYSELLARIIKAPTTVLLFPGIIPLVPGGSLYYTMSYMIRGNNEMTKINGISTLKTASGIAAGIIIVSSVVYHLNQILYKKYGK